jgi:hypothetical protein
MQTARKVPILDRRLASLTTRRSIRTLPLAEKGPLKFPIRLHAREVKPHKVRYLGALLPGALRAQFEEKMREVLMVYQEVAPPRR